MKQAQLEESSLSEIAANAIFAGFDELDTAGKARALLNAVNLYQQILEASESVIDILRDTPFLEEVTEAAEKIMRCTLERMIEELKRLIQENTDYLGEGDRDEKDEKAITEIVCQVKEAVFVEIFLLSVTLMANQIETGQGIPSEIVQRDDLWRKNHFSPIVSFLATLPRERQKELFQIAAEEIAGDEETGSDGYFLGLVSNRTAWDIFLDWFRERPIGAIGEECGIHIPLPPCYRKKHEL